MRIYPFIQYFFYLGINWNWRIAFHIIRHEIKGEKKYGIQTTGADELSKTKARGIDISHATFYMPANYLLLEEIFSLIPGEAKKHFLDIGSGKGRAMCVAAHHGFNRVTGIEFSPVFCSDANINLRITRNAFPLLEYLILNKDASRVSIPADVDCIFFFNPFDQFIMQKVAANILDSYNKKQRDIYIIYLNPVHKDELTGIGFDEVFHTMKLKYLEAVILRKSFTNKPFITAGG